MEDSNGTKWRILIKRSSRRCTAASSWDRTGSHRTDAVKTQSTLVILDCCHDHTADWIDWKLCPIFLHVNLNVFYELLKTDVHPYATSRGQHMTNNRPVRLPPLPPSLSYQCDSVCFISKSPVCWNKLHCYMLEFLFLKNVEGVKKISIHFPIPFFFPYYSFINGSSRTEGGWRRWAGHTEQLITSAHQCWVVHVV